MSDLGRGKQHDELWDYLVLDGLINAIEAEVDVGAVGQRGGFGERYAEGRCPSPLHLWGSSSAAARKDVHQDDQGDDYHCGDSDYGNRGRGDDHPRFLPTALGRKPLGPLA